MTTFRDGASLSDLSEIVSEVAFISGSHAAPPMEQSPAPRSVEELRLRRLSEGRDPNPSFTRHPYGLTWPNA